MTPESNTSTRRALLKGATAAAATVALAVPAAAGSPDPIFAAIEAHRRAWDRLGVAVLAHDAHNTAKTDAAQDAAHDAVADAEWELANTQPTTLAGAIALLQYTRKGDYLDFTDGEIRGAFFGGLESCLTNIS